MEFANIPTIETWNGCRQVSDDEWIGYRDGQLHRVRGKMPTGGHVLVQGGTSASGRVVVSGKIVINEARPSLWARLQAWVLTWI